MIDLTPLDVRNKRGDFKKLMRGYDPQEVDVFLEIIADRLEALTRENMALRERTSSLQTQVNSQTDREQAVQAALVTAQELRAEIRAQAQREAETIVREAETEARRLGAEADAEARTKLRGAERQLDKLEDAVAQIDRRRARFLKEFRALLQREMDVVAVEEGRQPLEERTIELDLGSRRYDESGGATVTPITQLDPGPPKAPPAPPSAHRQDNLTLYLDQDDGDGRR
ncbi:MAG: DivIVA domain-containing protein [Longimicrobiales bacterium]